jgi:hypothetical protein
MIGPFGCLTPSRKALISASVASGLGSLMFSCLLSGGGSDASLEFSTTLCFLRGISARSRSR